MSTWQIVTVCDRFPTESYYCFDCFFKSLQGVQPLVLTGELMGSQFRGLGTKPKWLYKAIKEKYITADHIAFVDCWDLFYAYHPSKTFIKFFEFNSPIVISAEKNCFPDDLKSLYDDLSNDKYRYLNSGMIYGETEAILTVLESMDLPNVPYDYRREDGSMFHCNDQLLWMQEFIKQPVPMVIDRQQALCQTLHDITIDEFDISENGIENKTTGSFPMIFHANGSAKDSGVKEPIIKYLGLR